MFLDEVGEMPLALQAKLLRVLETGEFRPLGGDAARRADVRWICATHRDLTALVAAGAFRQDLYYRLAGATLRLPPLRRRREDIEPLAQRFLAEAAGTATAPHLAPETLRKLWAHPWPGNVRELRNALLRARVLAGGEAIAPEHILLEDEDAPASDLAAYLALPLTQARERFTTDYLRALLERHGGNITHAATEGGTTRQALQHHLRKYGLGGD
jgi:DNA-binding NtrC family response regulator